MIPQYFNTCMFPFLNVQHLIKNSWFKCVRIDLCRTRNSYTIASDVCRTNRMSGCWYRWYEVKFLMCCDPHCEFKLKDMCGIYPKTTKIQFQRRNFFATLYCAKIWLNIPKSSNSQNKVNVCTVLQASTRKQKVIIHLSSLFNKFYSLDVQQIKSSSLHNCH